MQSRFNKILSSGLTCSLTSSLVGGVGSSQVFAAVDEDAIKKFVDLLNNCDEREDDLVKHMESMGSEEYYNFFIRARGRQTPEYSRALDVILYDRSAGENPLIPKVLEKINDEQLRYIVSVMYVHDIAALLSSLRKSGALDRFIKLYGQSDFYCLLTGDFTRNVAIAAKRYKEMSKSFFEAADSVNSKINKIENEYSREISSYSKSNWEDILTKAYSFNGVQKDLEDEKKKTSDLGEKLSSAKISLDIAQKDLEDEKKRVSGLESKLSKAKSAQFYTDVFSVLGTLASVLSLNWFFGNRNNNKSPNVQRNSGPFGSVRRTQGYTQEYPSDFFG